MESDNDSDDSGDDYLARALATAKQKGVIDDRSDDGASRKRKKPPVEQEPPPDKVEESQSDVVRSTLQAAGESGCSSTDEEYARVRYDTQHGEWRTVPGIPMLLVSSLGWIRRCNPKRGWTIAYKPKLDIAGYRRFIHQGKACAVHRAVCTAFHGTPQSKETSDHINRDRGDNRACNLRWASPSTQQHNRKKPRVQCNSKPVLVHHKEWDSYTPSRWFAGTNIAGDALSCSGATIRQAIRHGCFAKGYRVSLAKPPETQDDLPGEEWRRVSDTLKVSSMGRVQTTSNGVWQYKRTPPVSDGVGYALILINRRLHDVLYRTFYPDTARELTIDHINRNKADNRLCNLRSVTWSVQMTNKGHSKLAEIYA